MTLQETWKFRQGWTNYLRKLEISQVSRHLPFRIWRTGGIPMEQMHIRWNGKEKLRREELKNCFKTLRTGRGDIQMEAEPGLAEMG